MNSKLSFTFILNPLLLAIWISGSALNAHAEWELIAGNEDMGNIYPLESDGHRLYAGTQTGVYMSLDNGFTWLSTGLTDRVRTIAISDDALYAFVYEHGMFRSDDYGETWNPKNNGLHRIDDHTGENRLPSIRQILVTSSGMVIAVGYHDGTYISRDRGETWHSVYDEWIYPGNKEHNIPGWQFGESIWSMMEFDGYWWTAISNSASLFCSPDKGDTWEWLPNAIPGNLFEFGRVTDWAVLNDRLYLSGQKGFGRWNEMQGQCEYLTEGLPTGDKKPHLINLAVNRGRIFAGLLKHGVYMFDERSETWIPVGLDGMSEVSLISHQSDLYAATYASNEPHGILRASIPTVHSYGKAATSWGAVKRR